MGVKREEIRDTSPLSLKRLNDNFKYLWLQAFKNVNFGDLGQDVQAAINSKIGKVYIGSVTDINNGGRLVNLPPEWSGVNFKVLIGITKVAPKGSTGREIVRWYSCKVSNIDTVNGNFTITADGASCTLSSNITTGVVTPTDNSSGVSIDITYAAIS